jgi:hypothetical protein
VFPYRYDDAADDNAACVTHLVWKNRPKNSDPEGNDWTQVRKRVHFLSTFHIRILLPRQARDSGDPEGNIIGRSAFTRAICTVRSPLRCEKRHFLRHLYIKTIILPRQARNKHRENSKKEWRFSQGGFFKVLVGCMRFMSEASYENQGYFGSCRYEHAFCAPVYTPNDRFAKTGSGQAYEKLRKRSVFSYSHLVGVIGFVFCVSLLLVHLLCRASA